MNELITVEIDSKNKQKLLNVLHESQLIVEILNEEQTYVVIRDKELLTETVTVPANTPQTEEWKQTAFNYNISETT
jgi:hypothetical protein